MAQEFDFVIVGGGTAGCLLASRLANAPSEPSIALLEGGSDINKPEYRRTADRFTTVGQPGLSYDYVSTPQAHACNRQIPQIRGRGLGGSSAVNFQVWSLGAREEFDAWAEIAGDETWGFDSVIARIKKLENLHLDELTPEWTEYVQPDSKYHGFSGPIEVSIGPVERETKSFIDAGVDLGHNRNLDPNNGNPIGFSLNPTSSFKGLRTTSASAFLGTTAPANLTVFTNSRVVKIIFSGDSAIGVLTSDGSQINAKKEVILSAGALDTPRLLLLSGVGPKSDLGALGIKVVKDLDGVGKGLADHPMVVTCFQMKPGFTARRSLEDAAKYQEAFKQFLETASGPFLSHFSSLPHAFLKSQRAYDSPEFQLLSQKARSFLLQPSVPSFELVIGPVIPRDHVFDDAESGFFTLFVTNMNSQSRGFVKLASANADDPPLIDPKYLGHPFDLDHFVKPILAPKSDSDHDLLEFIQGNVAGLWHPSCSVRMGKSETDGSCVGGDLKVHGIKGLRVADVSVTSILPSGHPQIVAYVIGQVAADKIMGEYGL
ncbi:alcohol dehydrogenase [Colletotrichum orbiculare MAFF 240422]|uniref:Alcohol dehydrogenase n=1 Tax=Colletotrichum orbiculare (strain 104-T / ATCC 96160 / CBS 514.97 / LARS 414 / MAFF 240422) TaxID=1213857 RepID=A0A484FVT0_COLOR|nr:alcohol dehydrogenase [Colletotrichum orbiculare MAFF 240422]